MAQELTSAPLVTTVTAGHLKVADPLWTVSALLAAGLLVTAYFLPLWQMTLLAPQYPNDLHLTAYGTRMVGDLQEINTLNHYAGVKQIVPGDVIELTLFPFLLFGLVGFVVLAAFSRRRILRLAATAAVWAFPLGFLLDLQYWLYNFGHDLNKEAPLYPGPFTPKVLGRTKVVNFHSECMVSYGFWLVVAAAIIMLLGPKTVRFLRDSWSNTGTERKTALVAAIVAIVSGFAFRPAPPLAHAEGAGSLAALIAAAEPGSVVTVPGGHYNEQITIDKPLTLQGQDWPVIDGGRRGDVIRITADDVTLRGFVIQGSGREVSDEPTGIRLLGDRATIDGNRVQDVLYGITLHESDGHRVRGNTISSILEFSAERRGHALYLYYTFDNVFENNTISFAKDGIFVNFSARNLFQGNRVTHLRYGIHFMYADQSRMIANVFKDNLTGASIMYSSDLYFERNEFANSRSVASGYGILFKDVNGVEMVGNLIHHNQIGMTMEGSPLKPESFVRLRDNLIGFNGLALFLSTTVAAEFSGNSFVGNLRQIETKGGSLEHHNTWSIEGRGNYWDDYRGYDANGDGTGDIPYQYRAAYGELVNKDEALRAFSYTPAEMAIDLAARWFPVYLNPPTAVDNSPLMRPTIKLPSSGENNSRVLALLVVGALVLVPLATFRFGASSLRRAW